LLFSQSEEQISSSGVANTIALSPKVLMSSTERIARSMPTADSRSHSGCWTCRARRKKCPERSLPCTTCSSLNLLCYGYGPRPDWMDGGVEEKTKVVEFKTAVKQNLRQRRRSRAQSQSNMSMAETFAVGRPPCQNTSSSDQTSET